MKEELAKDLCDKFPNIFDKDFYFECDDGWYDIINKLCQHIESHCKNNKNIIEVKATQVKEKFGSLRFYISETDDFINGLISMAESVSSITCEACGNKGSKRGKSWVKTYCDLCSKSFNFK